MNLDAVVEHVRAKMLGARPREECSSHIICRQTNLEISAEGLLGDIRGVCDSQSQRIRVRRLAKQLRSLQSDGYER